MIAGSECFRFAVPGQGDLAAQHHDPNVEIVRVHILGLIGFLAAMRDLEAFPAQVAFERLAREGPPLRRRPAT